MLTADSAICCGWFVVEDDEVADTCPLTSRYQVARSDDDESFGENGGSAESCDEHLAETVTGMVNGGAGVQAVVAIRWDDVPEVPADANGFGWSYDAASKAARGGADR